MLYYLHFLHAADLAYVLRYLYTSIAYDRITDTRLNQVVRAVLFKKEPCGIDDAEHEPSKELAPYDNVCLIHNRFSCVPVCVLNSIVMRIVDCKIYIDRVTFNAHMITKIVEYVVDEEHWPSAMTKDEMLTAANFDYSMRAMDLFTARVPRGLSDPATWFIYDLPMAPHGFLTYMLEMYLIYNDILYRKFPFLVSKSPPIPPSISLATANIATANIALFNDKRVIANRSRTRATGCSWAGVLSPPPTLSPPLPVHRLAKTGQK